MNTPLTFPVLTAFTLSWTLTDASGSPINAATLTATLYAGRSITNPTQYPGTPVTPIVGFVLPFVSNGLYQGNVPATLNPPPAVGGFTLVLDAMTGSTPVYHAEEPVVIETSGSPVDLTTVDLVKAYNPTPSATNADDSILQLLITAWSTEFLRLTGTGDQGGDFTQSPFTAICTWNEVYDGPANSRLMLRNRPVRTVISLNVNGLAIPASSGFPSQGYVIDGSRRSITLRSGVVPFGATRWAWGGAWGGGGGGFPRGQQNVLISYTAGYSTTPADIVKTASEVVYLTYRSRNWLGELSRSVAGGGGSITYAQWIIPPSAQRVVDSYSRTL